MCDGRAKLERNPQSILHFVVTFFYLPLLAIFLASSVGLWVAVLIRPKVPSAVIQGVVGGVFGLSWLLAMAVWLFRSHLLERNKRSWVALVICCLILVVSAFFHTSFAAWVLLDLVFTLHPPLRDVILWVGVGGVGCMAVLLIVAIMVKRCCRCAYPQLTLDPVIEAHMGQELAITEAEDYSVRWTDSEI